MKFIFSEIRHFLNERKDEINLLLLLSKNCKVKEAILIKSSTILLTYNTIEGCFSKLNQEIFSFIAEHNIPITDLNEELQMTFYKYYHKNINDHIKLKEFYENKELTSISHKEICKKIALFSGNLDAKSIRDFSRKQIGISKITSRHGKSLETIKNLRNKLAHGEITFQEASQNYTTTDLKNMSTDCINFLEDVIKAYEDFFINNTVPKQ